MTKKELRDKHNKFQRDVSIFNNHQRLKAVDVMVVRQIEGGRTDANELAKAMKITKSQLLSSITREFFIIDGDTIMKA
ncbi:hypothetical protein [Vibrio metschnikovii]|uniref:hypothetical protein n=1 Tax=Vibrio metschnikovii TaxID=28172 RepID=UPI001C307D07|nr:hypothetical protein [Vibrio metschnikovii]